MKLRVASFFALLILLFAAFPGPASAVSPTWAPLAAATVRPGAATLTATAICTSNFVFHDTAGNVFLGTAAHCSSTDDVRSLDGCLNNSLPLGTPVRIAGATRPGTLAYNSWIAMDERGETDPDTCRYNDFALVRLDPADNVLVNPTVRFWGGPTGIVPSALDRSEVFGFGTSISRTGLTPHPKRGTLLRQSVGGQTNIVLFNPPGISGDSGSGIMDQQGRAFGVLNTFSAGRGINGAGNLTRMLDYARSSGFTDIHMAFGTEPFDSGVPAPRQDPVVDLLWDLLGLLIPA